MGHGVVIQPENQMPAPKLTMAADGTGSLRFFTSYSPPGYTGAGESPEDYTENIVAVTADHKATLTRKPFHVP